MKEISRKVAEWLGSLPNCSEIIPVKITLNLSKTKRMDYYGAQYRDASFPDKRHGSFYLAGVQPKHRMFRENVCWTMDNTPNGVWYVSGYWLGQDPDRNDVFHFHPFGPNFMMSFWWNDYICPNGRPMGAIDSHKLKPYDRFAMTVVRV